MTLRPDFSFMVGSARCADRTPQRGVPTTFTFQPSTLT